jgi:F-type H+-transporting ATPase subunit delta
VAERATIARPYAKAAFEYARDANAFAQWSQGLSRRQIVADPRVAALTKSPLWSAADLADLITDVAGAKLDGGCRISCACSRRIAACCCCRKSRRITRPCARTAENTVDVDVVSAWRSTPRSRKSSARP